MVKQRRRGGSSRKVLKRVYRAIADAPFAGRIAIRSVVYRAIDRRTLRTFLNANLLLVSFIVVHLAQGQLGLACMRREVLLPMQVAGLTYLVINTAVSLVQLDILRRVWRIRARGVRQGKRSSVYLPDMTGSEVIWSLIVTYGGQFGFMYLWLRYCL